MWSNSKQALQYDYVCTYGGTSGYQERPTQEGVILLFYLETNERKSSHTPCYLCIHVHVTHIHVHVTHIHVCSNLVIQYH